MASKKSTDALNQIDEVKEKSNFKNKKGLVADVSKSRISPGSVIEKLGPKLTARDLSTSQSQSKLETKISKDNITRRSNVAQHSSKLKNTTTTQKNSTSLATALDKSKFDNSKDMTKIQSNKSVSSKLKTVKSEESKLNYNKEMALKKVASVSKIGPTTSKHNLSAKQTKSDVKKPGKSTLAKDLPFVGVLVNSPTSRRKLIDTRMKDVKRESSITRVEREKKTKLHKQEVNAERERSKTRTLDDTEVKVINKEIDNNMEMKNLNHKLTAKPTAFFVDLDENKKAESDYSYEDDFDSYESDFESYQSEATEHFESEGTRTEISDDSSEPNDLSPVDDIQHTVISPEESDKGESSNYESRLDSGNFELCEVQRSASKVKPSMKYIEESEERDCTEDKKQSSLNDEGFQEMSTSSVTAVTKAVESLENSERPSFIDFVKSKNNKRLRLLREKQNKRAKDLLSMITLHKMSYNLFDLKPIPYDKFMTLYGKDNYNQAASQTFDDGENAEIQTDDIEKENKWTQHPIEFSNNEIHLDDCKENFNGFDAFSFLYNNKSDEVDINEEYKNNKLKIYLEQKNGVGDGKALPFSIYEKITSKCDYNTKRLNKFLVKVEHNIVRIVSKKRTDTAVKKSEWPFSESYVTLLENNKHDFLDNSVVSNVVFSETKDNLILTIHNSTSDIEFRKGVICLWDLNVASADNGNPVKVLMAGDNVAMCRYLGDERGIVAAGLDDGCVHLWDLSEPPVYHEETTAAARTPEPKHSKESSIDYSTRTIRSCAYTSSGMALGETWQPPHGRLVGMQFLLQQQNEIWNEEALVGQMSTLYEYGKLVIWRIIKEKRNKNYIKMDPGKANWSRTRLKISQIIDLIDFVDSNLNAHLEFNLEACKKRYSTKHRKKDNGKTEQSKRPPSSKSIDYEFLDDVDSCSVACAENLTDSDRWDSGVVCTDLKVACAMKCERYFVGRNCGQVICCERKSGNTKVTRYVVTDSATTITCVEPLAAHRHLVLAGGDAGRAWLLSLRGRVLLTLCVAQRAAAASQMLGLHWSARAPCRVLARTRSAVHCWDLARSDLAPAGSAPAALEHAALQRESGDLAVVTSSGEVQIHKLKHDESGDLQEKLLSSYLALL